MKLNIITPVSRPDNLSYIRKSIIGTICEPVRVEMFFVYDKSCIEIPSNNLPVSYVSGVGRAMATEWKCVRDISAIAGHAHRNYILDAKGNTQDWIMSLDDDNILHPDLIPWLAANTEQVEYADVIIFDQAMKDGTHRLTAQPDNVKPNHIDTAQYMWRGRAAEGIRFREDLYNADGYFIEEVYRRNKDKTLFVNQPLCYYNYLR